MDPVLALVAYQDLLEVLNNADAPFFTGNRGILRFSMREEYSGNYILLPRIESLFFDFGISEKKFNTSISTSLLISKLALSLIFSIVFCLFCVLFSVRSSSKSRYILPAVLLFLLYELKLRLLGVSINEHLMYESFHNNFFGFFEAFFNAFNMFIFGSYGTSLFGFTPRNFFSLCFFAVLLLRYFNFINLSYVVLILCISLHQSYAFLCISIVVGIDILVRPTVFKKFSFKAFVSAALTFCLSNETLFDFFSFEFWGMPFYLISVSKFVFIYFLIGFVSTSSAHYQNNDRIQFVKGLSFFQDSTTKIEYSILLTVFIFTFVIAYIISKFEQDYYSVHYFWAQLHGRLIGLYRPFFLFVIMLNLLTVLAKRDFSVKKIGLIKPFIVMFLLVALPFSLINFEKNYRQLSFGLEEITMFVKEGSYCPVWEHEHVLYFGLTKTITIGGEFNNIADWSICSS